MKKKNQNYQSRHYSIKCNVRIFNSHKISFQVCHWHHSYIMLTAVPMRAIFVSNIKHLWSSHRVYLFCVKLNTKVFLPSLNLRLSQHLVCDTALYTTKEGKKKLAMKSV